MNCRCANLTVLWDEDAKDYANAHLKAVEVRAGGWEVIFRCPVTYLLWLEDWPRSEEHGGGPRRLSRLGDEHSHAEGE